MVLPRTCVPMLSNDNVFLSLYGQSIIHPFNGRLAAGYIGSCASFLCCSSFTVSFGFKSHTMDSQPDVFSTHPSHSLGFLHTPRLPHWCCSMLVPHWPPIWTAGPQCRCISSAILFPFSVSIPLLCSWHAYFPNNTSKLDLPVCIIVYYQCKISV